MLGSIGGHQQCFGSVRQINSFPIKQNGTQLRADHGATRFTGQHCI